MIIRIIITSTTSTTIIIITIIIMIISDHFKTRNVSKTVDTNENEVKLILPHEAMSVTGGKTRQRCLVAPV